MGWALILSGGAAYGAVQVRPVLGLIAELGMPDAVFCTSVGNENGVMIAANKASDMVELWGAMDGSSMFQTPNIGLKFDGIKPQIEGPWDGLFNLEPLEKLHKERGYHRNLQINMWTGLVDAASQRYKLVHLNPMKNRARLRAIIASNAQPGIHGHEKFQGRWCFDGGVHAVISPLDDPSKYDEIHAICCSPIGKDRKKDRPQNEVSQAWEAASVAFEMLMSRVVRDDVLRLRKYATVTPTWLYAPESWEEIGMSFDAKRETIANRLDVVGPRMLETGIGL